MMTLIQPVLWVDEQARIPAGFCEQCGGECYHPSRLCPDCEEKL